jgi:hypothetical protein
MQFTFFGCDMCRNEMKKESTMKQNTLGRVAKPLALLAVGALTLMSAGVARADGPTVTITDDGEPHGVVTHMERFSC